MNVTILLVMDRGEEIKILPEWEEIACKITGKGERVMVVGGVDTGKTTLARYLLKTALNNHKEVTFLNADVGQASIGTPGTLSMKFFRTYPERWENILPDYQWFVGTVSPSGSLAEMITGIGYLTKIMEERGVEFAILDTSGLIRGEEGKKLKLWKSLIFSPTKVLLLERDTEGEEIYRLLRETGFSVERIKVGESVGKKGREERINFRRKRFSHYFAGGKIIEMAKEKTVILSSLSLPHQGQLVGLIGERGFLLGLGLWMGEKEEKVYIYTPLKNIQDLKIITVGKIVLDLSTGEGT